MIIFMTGIQITIFSLGMLCGCYLTDYSWSKSIEVKTIKCGAMDTTKTCIAKAKLQFIMKEQN